MPTIDKLVYSSRAGGSYVLSLSDGTVLGGLQTALLQEMGLVQGRELSGAELEKLRRLDSLLRARSVAARFINYRPRSRGELVERLERDGFADDVVAEVLLELEAKGELDDESFARQWVRGKAAAGKSGARLVGEQLAKRGVGRRLVEKVLAEELPAEEAFESARALAAKRAAGRDLDEPRERKRLQDYLLRRGFEWEIVEKVMKDLEDDGA